MASEEPIHRRHGDEAKRMRLRRRTKYLKKGRQQEHAGQIGYSHATASDDTELSHADVMGRQERHETSCGGGRGQCQGKSHAQAGKRQGFSQLSTRVALSPVTED